MACTSAGNAVNCTTELVPVEQLQVTLVTQSTTDLGVVTLKETISGESESIDMGNQSAIFDIWRSGLQDTTKNLAPGSGVNGASVTVTNSSNIGWVAFSQPSLMHDAIYAAAFEASGTSQTDGSPKTSYFDGGTGGAVTLINDVTLNNAGSINVSGTSPGPFSNGPWLSRLSAFYAYSGGGDGIGIFAVSSVGASNNDPATDAEISGGSVTNARSITTGDETGRFAIGVLAVSSSTANILQPFSDSNLQTGALRLAYPF